MKSTEDIQSFWQQLEQTIDELLASRSENQFNTDDLLNIYRQQLDRIDRNLTFRFECEEDSKQPIEMIFGCDGFPESIGSVLSLIGAAPRLQGVKFRAFNKRHDPMPTHINMGDETIWLEEFWFSLRLVKQYLQLDIYLADAPHHSESDPRIEASMIFLDAIIGEYELMTRIGNIDWLELPRVPEDFGCIPFAQLRPVFDELKQKSKALGITLH